MNSLQKFGWRLVISLVLIFGGGWILGGILNLAAIVSPQMVSLVECPAGSTVKEEWVQMSFDQPGQKTLTFHCIDQSGSPVPTLTDAQTTAEEYKYFYTAGVAIMTLLVAAWFIRRANRGTARAGADSAAA